MNNSKYWRMRGQWAYSIYELLIGSRSPFYEAMYSRIQTPLIGDEVVEISTISRMNESSIEGIGTLVNRLYDINDPVQPPNQDWDSYLHQINACNLGKTFNWTNSRFIVLADLEWMNQFRRLSIPECDTCYPDKRFDAMNRESWWWLAKAESQKMEIMNRAAKECEAKPC